MRTDSLIAHTEDVGPIVGEFYGTPIRGLDYLDIEVREISDAQQRARYFLGSASAPIEVFPGEVVKDNLIRRSTTAEVLGGQFYEEKTPEGRKASLAEAVGETLVTWRPGNQEFAIIHEEVAG